MYSLAIEAKCERASPPFFATMSTTHNEFWLNKNGDLNLVPVAQGEGSVCRRALQQLWFVLEDRNPTKKEINSLKKHLYIYTPKLKSEGTILHLRSVRPNHRYNWKRGHLIWGALSSHFLFAANTAFLSHTPILKALQQSAFFHERELLDFRMRAIRAVMQGKDGQGYRTMDDAIRSVGERATAALQASNQGVEFTDTMWGKPGDRAWWREFAPALSDWVDSQKGSLLSHLHGKKSIMSHLLSDKLRPADVRRMVQGVDWMVGTQKVVLEAALGNYFQENDSLLPVHLNMDLGIMAMSEHDAMGKGGLKQALVKRAIGGSGAIMIKLNQQIAAVRLRHAPTTQRGCIPPEEWLQCGVDVNPDAELDLDGITSDVFSNIPPMTEAELGLVRQSSPILQRMESSTLGSASLAEAHLSTDEKGEVVVVKFLRVHYALYFMCEVDYLLRDVWAQIPRSVRGAHPELPAESQAFMVHQARQLLLFIVVEFAKEFDYANEFENMKIGMQIYNRPELHVHSAQGLELNLDSTPYIVQSYVRGRSLTEQLEYANSLAGEEREAMLRETYRLHSNFNKVWTINTLMGTGDFHADAHGGNLRISEDGKELYVIDYGSFGRLSKGDRCRVIDAVLVALQFKSMQRVLPGGSLQPLAALLVQQRTQEGTTAAAVHLALTSLLSDRDQNHPGKGMKLSLEEKAQLLSASTRPWSVQECATAAELAEQVTIHRFNPNADLRAVRERVRAILGRPGLSDPVVDILLCFRELGSWTPTQLSIALNALERDSSRTRKLVADHQENLRLMGVFMRRLRRTCRVVGAEVDPEVAMNKRAALQLLNYSKPSTFGNMFMDWVLLSGNIGDCSFSAIALFGRGIAYVSGVTAMIWANCADDKLCPWNSLGEVLKSPILGSRETLLQIARFAMGKESPCEE